MMETDFDGLAVADLGFVKGWFQKFLATPTFCCTVGELTNNLV